MDASTNSAQPTLVQRMRKFFMADALSLKVVFDNLRNYLICGALMVAVNMIVANQGHSTFFALVPAIAKSFVVVLLLANVIQSLVIFDELETAFARFVFSVGRSRWAKWSFRILAMAFWVPLVLASYQFVPALVEWAIAGGKLNAL